MIDFSEYHPAVIAIAADMLGWEKCVNINPDGSLEWYGESNHPTDGEMKAKIDDAQEEYDKNGAKQ